MAAHPNATDSLVERLMQRAFHSHRDARSPEYQAGAEAWLRMLAGLAECVRCPYQAGTAAYDAFWAGTTEGIVIWHRHLDGDF